MGFLRMPSIAFILALGLAGAVSGSGSARAGDIFMLGDKLLKACIDEPTFCQGYVAGVADVLFGTEAAILGSRACPKTGTTIGDAAAVEWMQKNPERLKFTAYSVVAVALAESYPCE
jgi:hypothetical protein